MNNDVNIEEMIQRATQKAAALGVAVSIAAVDASGHLLGFRRMSGASFMTADIAIAKAWTSAAFRASSGVIEKNMAAAPAFASSVAATMGGRFMPRQGGLVDTGRGVAVGVSGGSADQDEDIARAALAIE